MLVFGQKSPVKNMTNRQAIDFAINAMKFKIKHIAFDANMYEKLPKSFPYNKKFYEEKQNLLEAIKMLENMKIEQN